MSIPPEDMKQEGFFDTILETVKTIGRTVVSAAPGVIRVVEPLVHEAIQRKLNPAESGMQPKPPLKRQPSIGQLLQDDSVKVPPSAEAPRLNGPANALASKVMSSQDRSLSRGPNFFGGLKLPPQEDPMPFLDPNGRPVPPPRGRNIG